MHVICEFFSSGNRVCCGFNPPPLQKSPFKKKCKRADLYIQLAFHKPFVTTCISLPVSSVIKYKAQNVGEILLSSLCWEKMFLSICWHALERKILYIENKTSALSCSNCPQRTVHPTLGSLFCPPAAKNKRCPSVLSPLSQCHAHTVQS